MTSPIDATVELVAELDRLSVSSDVAAAAPRSKDLYRYLASGLDPQRIDAAEVGAVVEHLMSYLGIWWSVDAYKLMPTMVPWCVRDRSCRYDQGRESWGSPRDDGYMRDDNSIIKKLPLPVTVAAPVGHPYDGRRPWRGFTACHIWRELPDGSIAGEDPWLYSFMPNLVWLPSWLAPLTDRAGSAAAGYLQRTSIARFREASVAPGVAPYAARSWSMLDEPDAGPRIVDAPPEFRPNPAFFKRRVTYLAKFVAGCDELLEGRSLKRKLICTRYTAELPQLAPPALSSFSNALRDYGDAVAPGLTAS